MFVDDKTRIRHMLDSARDGWEFAKGTTRAGLDADKKIALAIVKCIEIVGEAASKVSEATRKSSPQVPWAAIVGMRNRLIHGYYEIDLDRVWDTAINNLPPLVTMIEELLLSLPD